jgi:hypothetical protein
VTMHPTPRLTAYQRAEARQVARQIVAAHAAQRVACACVFSCADDPATACSLSGEFHVHPGEPCQVHPDAPGDR